MKSKGMRLNTVVLLSIIGTVVLVLSFAMLVFLHAYQQSLIRNAKITGRRSIAQVSSTVNDYLSSMDGIMEYLETVLENGGGDLEGFFDVFLKTRPDVVAVTIYDSDGNLTDCYCLGHEARSDIRENLSFNPELMPKYGKRYISSPHVVSIFEGYYPWAVTIVSRLNGIYGGRYAAIDISCSNISSYINDVGIGQRGYCFLMDTDGNIVYHPQQQLIYYGLKSENTELISSLPDGNYQENNVIYTLQTLENGRWRVVGISFVQEVISESMGEVAHILVISAVLILSATLVISTVLSSVLSRPLGGLAAAMKQFEQDADSFSYKPVGGAMEVRALSESFGHMVLQIQRLMATVRSEEINLRKTELRALQAQINPHFLYNTLDSISWMCERGKNAEAVHMVNALARLFRISISRGHELIPIRRELQHAESYLQIQSYRYKDQFVYSFDVDESCLNFLCNKITLQPIIENAIYHGINGLVDQGCIKISVKPEGGDIVFTVEDNGAGMDDAQVAAIMSKERSDHTGIGIKNVNDRLKIYFGSKYGIEIHSIQDEGTKVTIRMPAIHKEAEYENR